MKVTTWNAQGIHLRKLEVVEKLLEDSDVLCLRETWRGFTFDEEWQSVICLNTSTHKSGPSCGGVTLLVQPHLRFTTKKLYTTRFIQAVVGTVMRSPNVGCYISPKTAADTLHDFLNSANTWLRGPGNLVGDLNSRDSSWDDTTNRRGAILRRWTARHNFATQRPHATPFQTTLDRAASTCAFTGPTSTQS